jgi:nucleotide-binding universal stress UspA family protein
LRLEALTTDVSSIFLEAIVKTILVCLDSSPRAPRVLAAAIDLARRTSTPITLFRSVGLPPDISHVDVVGLDEKSLLENLLAAAKRGLLRYAEEVPSELLVAVQVVVGTPWSAICAEAKTCGADLVVIGSHGYSGLDRILGTTAAKVVNHAECSVLVVR